MTDRFRLDPPFLWVGGRRWPIVEHHCETHKMPPSDYHRRGWWMRTRQAVLAFEPGWRVSIIWGDATYSDNYDSDHTEDGFVEEPERVEVMVSNMVGDWGPGDEPLGYVSVAVANRLLTLLTDLPADMDAGQAWLDEHGLTITAAMGL